MLTGGNQSSVMVILYFHFCFRYCCNYTMNYLLTELGCSKRTSICPLVKRCSLYKDCGSILVLPYRVRRAQFTTLYNITGKWVCPSLFHYQTVFYLLKSNKERLVLVWILQKVPAVPKEDVILNFSGTNITSTGKGSMVKLPQKLFNQGWFYSVVSILIASCYCESCITNASVNVTCVVLVTAIGFLSRIGQLP